MSHFVLCGISETAGMQWYVCFVYVTPTLQDHPQVWNQLSYLLDLYSCCISLGEFN